MPHFAYRVPADPDPACGTAEGFDSFFLYQIIKQIILNRSPFVVIIDHSYRHNHILLPASGMLSVPAREDAYTETSSDWDVIHLIMCILQDHQERIGLIRPYKSVSIRFDLCLNFYSGSGVSAVISNLDSMLIIINLEIRNVTWEDEKASRNLDKLIDHIIPPFHHFELPPGHPFIRKRAPNPR